MMWDLLSKLEKIKKYIQILCGALELIAAALMLVGILFSMFSLVRNVGLFGQLLTDTSAFKRYLEQVFMLVIGIEFLIMLCRPNSENVIDVLLFLVARHMIVIDTTPYQDFVSVISVALLCVVRRYLRNNKENREEKKHAEQGREDKAKENN
ncbi:MAG: hypothetical protein K2M81_04975 [Lachnospiraceae bacterium]|nr:hypothetical protein [Lachnospiraceae bacterium]